MENQSHNELSDFEKEMRNLYKNETFEIADDYFEKVEKSILAKKSKSKIIKLNSFFKYSAAAAVAILLSFLIFNNNTNSVNELTAYSLTEDELIELLDDDVFLNEIIYDIDFSDMDDDYLKYIIENEFDEYLYNEF